MMKKLILCADDFGQNHAISEGILELVRLKRLNAVSCMVNGAAWPQGIEKLKSYDVEIGLHLNLTHGSPLTLFLQKPQFPSLPKLLSRLFILDQEIVYQEILAQINQFKTDVGFYPHFIDGHQHVHQFPVVREALFRALEQLPYKPWLRSTYTEDNQRLTHFFHWKRWTLYFLGGRAFARLLKYKNYRTNKDFSGDYTFSENVNYPKRFRHFLSELSDQSLVMCHPGKPSLEKSDVIASIRPYEYEYFKSDEFLKDLQDFNFSLMT